MSNPWIPILSKLKLSRAEGAAVKRYEHDPDGRGFLPIADVLRNHGRVDESLELLTQGVARHPSFTVARVVLARELLNKGMVAQAWTTLDESNVSLHDNVLAQKLFFRLAILLHREQEAKDLDQLLQSRQMHDTETRLLGELIVASGFGATREKLIGDYREQGVELLMPEPTSPPTVAAAESAETTVVSESPPDKRPGYLTDKSLYDFHVVPLDEVFQGLATDSSAKAPNSGVELDSTTLAELYCRQGHFGKALSVYRRLLRISPHNDLIRRKLKEVTALERQQRSDDLTVDPGVVDQMEEVEILDRQAKFFQGLLERLEQGAKP